MRTDLRIRKFGVYTHRNRPQAAPAATPEPRRFNVYLAWLAALKRYETKR